MDKTVVYKNPDSTNPNSPQDLDQLVKGSNRILYRCTTVFPFTLFPDTIIVDQNKIDIIHKTFFFTQNVFTLMINDVRTVKVEAGPFFATLRFEVIGYEQNPAPVRFLPKSSAYEVRKIIMGLTAAKRQGVAIAGKSKKEIKKKIKKIGKSRPN